MNLATSKRTKESNRVKAQLEKCLTATGYVKTRGLTADGRGGQTEAFTGSTAVSCYVGPLHKEDEANYAGVLKGRKGFELHVKTSISDFAVSDRFLIGSTTYEIVAIDSNWTLNPIRRAVLVLIT